MKVKENEEMKKYSFVIPAYQSKKMLRNTLEVLNLQCGFGKQDYEVIIVDDGSTDNTEMFIHGVNRNYDLKYIYLERNEASCRSRARNFGWRAAEGEFIIFIDADILVKNNYLLELERFFRINQDLLVVGTRIMLPHEVGTDIILNGSVFEKYQFNQQNQENMEFRHKIFMELSYNASRMRYPFLYSLSCNLALHKKWLERIDGFDEELKKWGIEDIEMVYRAYEKGIKIVINSHNEVLHQFHGVHGNFVEEDKVAGVRENTEIFLRKHRGAILSNDQEIYELFNSIATCFRKLESKEQMKNGRVIVEFDNLDKLNDIKKIILTLSKLNGIDILVNDYVEDTDLDIWIQLLEDCNSIPAYYPISKKIISEEEKVCKVNFKNVG